MNTRLTAEEERDLIARAQAGDREAETRLVVGHLRAAYRVVNRYARETSVPREDLEQEAALGLLLAVRRFDPARGTRLVTYALCWVRRRVERTCRRWRCFGQEPPGVFGRLEQPVARGELPLPAAATVELLAELTPRERAAVELAFGLNGHGAHTQLEMGTALGVGRPAAGKLYLRALARLRRLARPPGCSDPDAPGRDGEAVAGRRAAG
jgi:RNA polymerase sigma factor (sigma-70 family)